MLRLVLSIIVGFVVTAVLSTAVDHVLHITGVYPPYGEPMFDTELLLLASSYRFVFQVLGCYAMAFIAKDKATTVAWIVGLLGAALWLLGTFLNRDMGPLWYGMAGAVLSLPSTLLGVKLYSLRATK
jgi:hypothetical protein